MNYFVKASTDNFQRFDLGLQAHLIIINDSALNEIDFSFDGQTINGVVRKDEGFEFLDLNASSIFIKSTLAGNPCTFRIYSFGNPEVIYSKENTKNISGNSALIPDRFISVKRNGVD